MFSCEDLTMQCMLYAIAGCDAQRSIAYAGRLVRHRHGKKQMSEQELKVAVELAFISMDTHLLD